MAKVTDWMKPLANCKTMKKSMKIIHSPINAGVRVAVDHNSFVPQGPQSAHTGHAAPIKLHTAANAVWPTAQDDDARVFFFIFAPRLAGLIALQCQKLWDGRNQVLDLHLRTLLVATYQVDIMLLARIGQVQIIGLCRILRGQGVNLLDHRHNAQLLSKVSNMALHHRAS